MLEVALPLLGIQEWRVHVNFEYRNGFISYGREITACIFLVSIPSSVEIKLLMSFFSLGKVLSISVYTLLICVLFRELSPSYTTTTACITFGRVALALEHYLYQC